MRLTERFARLTIWNKLGVFGTIASIVGLLPLFMVGAGPSVEPRYTVGWHDLIAATTDNTPKLKVTLDGKEYPNVYTARIALWNQGRQFMDKSLMSSSNPIRVIYPDGVKVLSAQVMFTSRRSLNLQSRIQSYEGQEAVILEIVGDDALEYHEGVILGLTYTKSPTVGRFGHVRGDFEAGPLDFEVKGRIKGRVDGLQRVAFYLATTPRWLNVGAATVFTIFTLHLLFLAVIGFRASHEPAKPLEFVVGVIAIVLSFGLCFRVLYYFVTASVDWPAWIGRAA